MTRRRAASLLLSLLAGAPPAAAGDCLRRLPAGRPSAAGEPRLVPFRNSPFPYDGNIPGDENRPFLDYDRDGRRGHTSPRGDLHLVEEAYSDRHSLLYIPRRFTLSPRSLVVVFLHGNRTRLMRDVCHRQRIPQQLAASGLNAVLAAPQFAVDVADSSAGAFWQPGAFGRYLDEAAAHLAALYGDACAEPVFARMGVVVVAYSGGYNPAAYALDVGGAGERVRGVALFDALYGEIDRFERWIERRGTAFFFSAFSESSRTENEQLRRRLAARSIPISPPGAALRLRPGGVSFLPVAGGVAHNDFMTEAWRPDPLAALLRAVRRLPEPRTAGRMSARAADA